MKSAFISVVGRPSSGKSTLTNLLAGHKLSIVSPVPQTTRNRIRGIVTTARGQLVLLDTPGYHLSERRMNLKMRDVAIQALEESDLVLYVLDTTRDPGEEEAAIADKVAQCSVPVVAALNKIDACKDLGPSRAFVATRLPGATVVEISALQGDGRETLLDTLYNLAPEGDLHYDDEMYTDQSPEFRISEILREKAINAASAEVPHCLYVEIADLEMREEPYRHLWVRGFLVVEREGQKGILVGRGGDKIRAILADATRECLEVFPYPVKLDVRVRVRPKWRNSEDTLKGLVY